MKANMFGAFLMINVSCLFRLEQCCIAEVEWYSLTVLNKQKNYAPKQVYAILGEAAK